MIKRHIAPQSRVIALEGEDVGARQVDVETPVEQELGEALRARSAVFKIMPVDRLNLLWMMSSSANGSRSITMVPRRMFPKLGFLFDLDRTRGTLVDRAVEDEGLLRAVAGVHLELFQQGDARIGRAAQDGEVDIPRVPDRHARRASCAPCP